MPTGLARGVGWILVIAVPLAGLLGWQQREAALLRAAITSRRERLHERDGLASENRRLAAAQPSDAEMEGWVSRLKQAEQLRAQLAALRGREEAAAKASRVAQPAAEVRSGPSLAHGLVAADHWQNVGQATPDAAFETALWAAATGDLDALTGVLGFDASTREEAAALFERLPPAMQSEIATPERMMAVLTAMDVPLGRAMIVRQEGVERDGINLTAQLTDAGGRATTARFSMKADAGRWQLQVPASVVRKYAAAWDGGGR